MQASKLTVDVYDVKRRVNGLRDVAREELLVILEIRVLLEIARSGDPIFIRSLRRVTAYVV